MAFIARTGKPYAPPPPEGEHRAVFAGLEDLGMVLNTFTGKQQHKINLVWELETENPETKKRHLVKKRCTFSLHPQANLRAIVGLMLGRKLGPDETEYDLELLLGMNFQLTIVHRRGDRGGLFANIAEIQPIKGNLKVRDYERRANGAKPDITDEDVLF